MRNKIHLLITLLVATSTVLLAANVKTITQSSWSGGANATGVKSTSASNIFFKTNDGNVHFTPTDSYGSGAVMLKPLNNRFATLPTTFANDNGITGEYDTVIKLSTKSWKSQFQSKLEYWGVALSAPYTNTALNPITVVMFLRSNPGLNVPSKVNYRHVVGSAANGTAVFSQPIRPDAEKWQMLTGIINPLKIGSGTIHFYLPFGYYSPEGANIQMWADGMMVATTFAPTGIFESMPIDAGNWDGNQIHPPDYLNFTFEGIENDGRLLAQIRSGKTKSECESGDWYGATGKDTYFPLGKTDISTITSIQKKPFVQYRVLLSLANVGATPILTNVSITFRGDSPALFTAKEKTSLLRVGEENEITASFSGPLTTVLPFFFLSSDDGGGSFYLNNMATITTMSNTHFQIKFTLPEDAVSGKYSLVASNVHLNELSPISSLRVSGAYVIDGEGLVSDKKKVSIVPQTLSMTVPGFDALDVVIPGLKAGSVVSIKIYTLGGKQISTLKQNYPSLGETTFRWSPANEDLDLNPGIYLVESIIDGVQNISRFVVVKD